MGRLRYLPGVSGPDANTMDCRAGRRLEHGLSDFADRVRRTFEAGALAPRHDPANGSSGFTDLRRALEAGAPAPRHDLANGSSGFTDLRRALEAGAPAPRHDLPNGSSGFTDLRRSFEAGATRRGHNKGGKSAHKAYIVGGAVAVAAAVAAPVSVALFTGSPGAGDHGTERRGVVERKSTPASVATTRPAPPSSAADPEPPHTDPNAIPGTTARAKVPTRPFSNSSDSGPVSSGSPSPIGAPAPPAPAPPPAPPVPPAPPAPTFPRRPHLPAP
jgi:hypothetical protein